MKINDIVSSSPTDCRNAISKMTRCRCPRAARPCPVAVPQPGGRAQGQPSPLHARATETAWLSAVASITGDRCGSHGTTTMIGLGMGWMWPNFDSWGHISI